MWSVEFRDVPKVHCFSILLYTLINFWLDTQRSNTNLNYLFSKNIKFDKLLSEIGYFFFLQKRKVKLNLVSMIRSVFLTFKQRPVSTKTLLKGYKNVFGMLGKHFIKRCYNVILCGYFNVVITFLLTLYYNVLKTFFENILKTFLKTFLQR
mgnify:CR=1 FL=1